MSAPTPSWYDLLGVEPDASADEIRAAWKAGIAELEPTDRRFRVLNQAAEVLLDQDSRSDYDQALTSEASAASEGVEPAVVEEVAQRPSRDPSEARRLRRSRSDRLETLATDAGTQPPAAERGPFVVPAWLLAGLALATLVFAGLSIWQVGQDDPSGSSSSQELTPSDARDAQVAAERAAVAILAYDYRDLEGSRDEAVTYMTDDYLAKYDQLFDVLEQNAPNTKTIVRAELVASAVGLIGDDRVQVLVFVNRPTLNAELTEPEIYKDQATLTMLEVDGEWLVDDMTTTLPTS
jgi:Mce-associated membrane protein